MSEITLFSTANEGKPARRLQPGKVGLEKNLQSLCEHNMEEFFGVHFLASEWAFSSGRMDSVGIDENCCPVIVEYKRGVNENVVMQGLFYLDWLMDHRAEFYQLVVKQRGVQTAEKLDWSAPWVICVANDYTRYDLHAVSQIRQRIRLVRYQMFDDLLLLEHLNVAPIKAAVPSDATATDTPVPGKSGKTHRDKVAAASGQVRGLYQAVCQRASELGEDASVEELKLYAACRRTRNFACIELLASSLYVFLSLDPALAAQDAQLLTDVSGVGHWGTGNLRATVSSMEDVERLLPYLKQAYDNA